MAERSKALIHLSWSVMAWVRVPLETYIFILNFPLLRRFERLRGAQANEIKHDYSPEVILVLDSRYDLLYKALYIYSRSIALRNNWIFVYFNCNVHCIQRGIVLCTRSNICLCICVQLACLERWMYLNVYKYVKKIKKLYWKYLNSLL